VVATSRRTTGLWTDDKTILGWRVVLAVINMWPDGRHQILAYQAASGEATEAWAARFVGLTQRGLDPDAVCMVVSAGRTGLPFRFFLITRYFAVCMVVSAGRTGLPTALTRKRPAARQQRGVVHTIRGVEQRFLYRDLRTHDPLTQEPLTPEVARRLRCQHMTGEAHAIVEAPTHGKSRSVWPPFKRPGKRLSLRWYVNSATTLIVALPSIANLDQLCRTVLVRTARPVAEATG
jgi:hypothetical protein